MNHLATRGWAYLRVAIYRYSFVALDWSRWIGRAGLVALDPAVSEDKGVATMATSHALNPVTI